MSEVTMEKLVNLCKARGFIFPGSEIYGGLANSWDYGPLGTELKRNITNEWWKRFVTSRTDMVGLDAAVIMNPKVWEASGHLANFTDPLVECKKCHIRYRADQIETFADVDRMKKRMELGLELDDDKIFDSNKEEVFWVCENCKEKNFGSEPRNFNLLFKTFIGATEDASSLAYLRGELAQAMFVDFPQVLQSSRKRIPFGIAQQGKCFRNEITPGNFIFRTREFNLMEFEYFIHPTEWEKHFEFWLGEMKSWLKFLGVDEEHLFYHEIEDGERAHYSKRTIDIEYHYPFGLKELYGLAYRTDFDLKRHMEASGKDLRYTDPMTNEKYIPHVIEPTFGIDRTLLVVLLEAYHEEQAPTAVEGETDLRVVLRLPKELAPFKIAVLPLSKKDELNAKAKEVLNFLLPNFACDYDETQAIGKRYRRQDEIGTPFCVTVDFESLTDGAVTVRDRDSMKQERVEVKELVNFFKTKLC